VDSLRGRVFIVPSEVRYNASLPWIVEAGVCWNVNSIFTILSSVELQRWAWIADNYRDVPNVHIGGAVTVTPNVLLRCGFFTQFDPITSTSDYISQNFITAGIAWSAAGNVLFSASVLDSHLFGKSVSYSPSG